MYQMKYVDGLNYLDQLKDYVETSVLHKENMQLTTIIQKAENFEKVEEIEHAVQMEDPLSHTEKLIDISDANIDANIDVNIDAKIDENIDVNFDENIDKNLEEIEESEDFDLIEIVKDEISDKGEI